MKGWAFSPWRGLTGAASPLHDGPQEVLVVDVLSVLLLLHTLRDLRDQLVSLRALEWLGDVLHQVAEHLAADEAAAVRIEGLEELLEVSQLSEELVPRQRLQGRTVRELVEVRKRQAAGRRGRLGDELLEVRLGGADA